MNAMTNRVRRLYRSTWESDKLLFLLVGGANTVLTLLIYEVLLFVLPYTASYSISFVCGVAISTYLNARVSFKVPLSFRRVLKFSALYIALYLIGLQLVVIAVEDLEIHQTLAPLVVIVVIVPLSYVSARFTLTGRLRAPR